MDIKKAGHIETIGGGIHQSNAVFLTNGLSPTVSGLDKAKCVIKIIVPGTSEISTASMTDMTEACSIRNTSAKPSCLPWGGVACIIVKYEEDNSNSKEHDN